MAPGNLLHNLLVFGRLLRDLGLDAGPDRILGLIQALEHIDISRPEDFFYAARGLLVHRRADQPIFDRAFSAFWRHPGTQPVLAQLPGHANRSKPKRTQSRRQPYASILPRPEADIHRLDDSQVEILGYSNLETLQRKDFGALNEEEWLAVRQMISALVWRPGIRWSRRMQTAHRGPRPDLRRTLRGSLRHGGQVLTWAFRQPKWKPRPLVVLADISGSMEPYTRLLLYFLHRLNHTRPGRMETFLFSTRLTRVSRYLKNRDPLIAIQQLSVGVADWSGGTRTGQALQTFNCHWARRVLSRGAVVLIISDGWDQGDPAMLQREISRLQRSAWRLIWLNPLLGTRDYQPLTRGMQAAMPFIDEFLPAHNLLSLERLARKIGDLSVHPVIKRRTDE